MSTPNPDRAVKTTPDDPMRRMDPDLREKALEGGSQLVKVSVLVKPGVDLSRYFEKMLVRPGVEFDRVIGLAKASNLIKLATVDGALAVLNLDERPAPEIKKPADIEAVEPIRRNLTEGKPVPLDRASLSGKTRVKAPESFFTNDTNGVKATWALGTTGDGDPADPVKIAVIDTGVDFANPDLFGTQARVVDPTSPYYNWPIAFDSRSMIDFALDIQDYRGNWGWYMSAATEIQDPDLGSTDPFSFTVTHPDWDVDYSYTISSSLQLLNTNGGMYRFGWHPDDGLVAGFGEALGVLVTGEGGGAWGDFDTVYVDLTDDYSFDNDGSEGWATQGQEIACINYGWSTPGNCDISGGMIYFIADGVNPLPATDWMYGLSAPEAGSVVAFMLNDYTEGGGDHGTLCAGTAIGQGVIDEMPYGGTYGSTYWPPTWYNPATDAISAGPAKDASLVAMGNFYQGGSQLDNYDFTVLGYDGIPAGDPTDHFDQPHMNSNSYGSGSVENDGWDLSSRYVTLLNNGYVAQFDITLPDGGAHSSLFVTSSGNSGFGYGTVTSPGPETAVTVGTDTVFGQFNLGDTARFRDWVNWGDLGGFSDRGPRSTSTIAPQVLANGFFGSGNLPLNYFYGGDWSVDFWSGTSRSGPEVMGILALIYDAYYEAHGMYPSWREARNLLMNGARTLYNDPFAQGAGLANAFNSVEIINGTRGVQVTSEEGNGFWIPGTFMGTKYEGFARGLFQGVSDTTTFTVANAGVASVDVTIEPIRMELYHTREWNFTSLPLATEGSGTRYYDRLLYGAPGSNKGFGGDDPLFLNTIVTDTQLLQDADLMVVRLSYPYEQFQDTITDNWWFIYGYPWRDTDADGTWFNDLNGNRVRNSGEFPAESETVRINYNYVGNNAEVRIREPWDRMNGVVGPNEPPLAAMDGLLISLRHFYSGGYDTTDLFVTIELYKEAPWTDISVSDPNLTIPAGGTNTFDATATAGLDQPPGEYAGFIKVGYTSPYAYAEYIPVDMQVWFSMDVDPTLGGVDEPTLYDNGVVFGGNGPSSTGQRAESGDWRFFFGELDDAPPAGSFFLAHTTWTAEGDAPNDTDIDTLFYGPVATDSLFTGQESLFGPSGLQVIGGSQRAGSAPNWEYFTSTGGPEDWSSALLTDAGLYNVAAQVVRWGGELTRVPFQINVGTAQVTPTVDITGEGCAHCTAPVAFKTIHADLEGETLEALAYGFTRPKHVTDNISQSEYWYYNYHVTAGDAFRLDVRTSLLEAGYDIDLTVYYDGDVVGYSGRADSEEQVTLYDPPAGDYLIEVYGYGVPMPHEFDLFVEEVSGLGAFTVTGIPASIALGTPYDLTLHFTDLPVLGEWMGLLMLGPVGAPTAIEVPIYVHNAPPLMVYLPIILSLPAP